MACPELWGSCLLVIWWLAFGAGVESFWLWFILRYAVDETLRSKNWHLAYFSLLLLQVCTVWVRLPHTLLRWPFWVTDLTERQRTSPGWAKASCMTLGVSASNLRFVVALRISTVLISSSLLGGGGGTGLSWALCVFPFSSVGRVLFYLSVLFVHLCFISGL